MSISTVAALRELMDAVDQHIGKSTAGIGLVLGSGLGGLAAEIEDARRVPYSRLPHLAASTVQGHAGELVAGRWKGRDVLVLAGRVHRYEGHSMEQVVLPVRMLAAMGVHTLIVSNAAGSVHTGLQPGDLMLLSDHINFQGTNPLVGPNDARLGPRFPDMTVAYDAELRALAHRVAASQQLALKEGVYAAVLGPSYETPAEVRMLAAMGADAVGMSTVPEVIVARHMGVRVLGLSCITNLGAGLGAGTLDHAHVGEVAGKATQKMVELLGGIVQSIPNMPGKRRLP
jgi:purine-nucleoside phosphorylase